MSISCKAAIFKNIKEIEYKNILLPTLENEENDEVILKVIVSGICGSDLHPYHGKEECFFGTVFGHECVGEIISKGNSVKDFNLSEIVIIPFSIACGKCFYCKQKLSARCKFSQLFGNKKRERERISIYYL